MALPMIKTILFGATAEMREPRRNIPITRI
jgi:hypothetical protein